MSFFLSSLRLETAMERLTVTTILLLFMPVPRPFSSTTTALMVVFPGDSATRWFACDADSRASIPGLEDVITQSKSPSPPE
ncbi:MAG: hypothetical protein Q4D04_07340 [Clostridia bacterium]|nr:hypothetical protein [Clostridia bacterium]